MTYIVSLFVWYNIKYNRTNWERNQGLFVKYSLPDILPGDERYPAMDTRPNPEDFFDKGFKNRKVFLD